MQDNESMDFYTNLVHKIKESIPYHNVLFVGNNYQTCNFS